LPPIYPREALVSWIDELSAVGLDPEKVVDAVEPFHFEIPKDPKFIKGCVIGDPCNCSASKAIKSNIDVTFVWVGAHMAIIAFANGSILRYQHNGVVPKSQDNLIMPPPGKYRLIPPKPSNKLGARRRTGQRTGDKPATGRRLSMSTAGILRR
jgi:hypothetical protein